MSDYRLEYQESYYRGVYGSGEDGYERTFHSHLFSAPDDSAAVTAVKRFLGELNSPVSTQSYRSIKLVRIVQPEQSSTVVI